MKIQIAYRWTNKLSMRIVKNGDVHVTAPVSMPRSKVEAFIEKNSEWIAQARKRNEEHQHQRQAFFGQLPLQTNEQKENAMNRLKVLVEPLVEQHARQMGVKPSIVYYQPMISRWGQCNVKDGAICFSAYLLLLPEWCVEHIVVHELCHLLEPRHNARFYELMDRYYPRWKEARKETRRLCMMKEQD